MYVEDMIMMCHYFGCKIAEETNFALINPMFELRGYANFLHRFFDSGGLLKLEPGEDSQAKQKMDHFRILDDFVDKHGMRINHPEILEDCEKLQDDFGKFDRLVACAMSLKAAKNDDQYIPRDTVSEDRLAEDKRDLFRFYQRYTSDGGIVSPNINFNKPF
jgi:hypothetical protein